MTRIVADLGNSRLKWGRVDPDGRLGATVALPPGDPAAWVSAWDEWGLTGVESTWSVASVNPPLADRLGRFLEDRGVGAILWHRSAAEVSVSHELEQPTSTGADRALAVVGALGLRRGLGPGLVVSCGTAVTVERISSDGVWQGGAIAPGLGPMAKALHLMTAQLPEVAPGEAPEPYGRSTVPAIEAGVFWGVVGSIRELLTRQAIGLSPNPWLIWTGGDASTFARWVGWPGAEVVPHLVLEGLRIEDSHVGQGLPCRNRNDGRASPALRGDRFFAAGRIVTPRPRPFVSILTAQGRGAVAVVRVWGPGALALADRMFRPNRGKSLARSPVGRLRVGRVGSGLGDEVVAVVIDGESSEVEIQCHGGSAAVALVVEALVSGGGKVRSPRAWARHSSGSAIQAEAAFALASAPTARVAEILLDQAEGALDEELRRIFAAEPGLALSRLDSLIERGMIGIRLVDGWRVVLAGRPNVGKSRLLNALAGYERAIVAPTPGTTRDVVTVLAAFEGWPVELADTAGLRSTLDPIEAEGVALARARQRGADLVVVVLDRSEPLDDLDRAVLLDYPEGLVVANKSDLPAAWDEATLGALAVSAERGDGVEGLVEEVARRLVPDNLPIGSGVPFRPVHLRRLLAIRECYRSGRTERGRRSLARWTGGVPDQ